MMESHQPLNDRVMAFETTVSTEDPTVEDYRGTKDPADENIFDMIRFIMCPNFNWKSWIVVISLLNVLVWLWEVSVCPLESNRLLAPKSSCLVSHGAAYAYCLRTFHHYHRLIMATLMHSSYIHLSMNLIGQFLNGFLITPHLPGYKLPLLYFGSGVTGCMFAQVIKDKVIVGASTAIMGMFGAILALLFTKNITLKKTPLMKVRLLFVACITFFSFGQQIFDKYVRTGSTMDVEGHIGGAIGGFLLCLFLSDTPSAEPVSPFRGLLKYTGLGLYIFFLVSELGIFFYYRQPVDIYNYYD
jgi:membrane associated rhomboid family serine protease